MSGKGICLCIVWGVDVGVRACVCVCVRLQKMMEVTELNVNE